MLIELIEEGPQNAWLVEKADGYTYRLHNYRGTNTYRLDILREHGRARSHTEEFSFESEEEAIAWAHDIFIQFLSNEEKLPKGGAIF